MNSTDGIEPVTTLKTRPAELIRRTRTTRRPVIITQNGRATAVLQDVETFEQQRRALLLLMAISRGEQDYRAGRVVSDAAARRRVDRLLARLQRG